MWQLKDLSVINLNMILADILECIRYQFGMEIITSAHRPGDPGIHGVDPPLRAVDLRVRNEDMGKMVAAWVNERWSYDHKRPTMHVGLPHGEGLNFHLHVQVHPNTTRIA